jgi:hypothetical protein
MLKQEVHYKSVFSAFNYQFINYENTIHSEALPTGLKWPEQKAGHSSPSSAKDKHAHPNIWQRKEHIFYEDHMYSNPPGKI